MKRKRSKKKTTSHKNPSVSKNKDKIGKSQRPPTVKSENFENIFNVLEAGGLGAEGGKTHFCQQVRLD